MSESLPTVDKISCDAEIEPSVGSDPGTVDRLNEAPLCINPYDTAIEEGEWFMIQSCPVSDEAPSGWKIVSREGQPG